MPFTGRYHLVRNWWLPTDSFSPLYVLDRRDRKLRHYRGDSAAWEPRIERRMAAIAWEKKKARIASQPSARHAVRLAERLLDRHCDCQSLAAFFDKNDLALPFRLGFDTTLGSFTTVALNNNYVAGTSGNAVACCYATPVGGKTLNSLYFFVSSYTGTAANVNDINLEVRAEASAGATTPNTAATVATATKDPASATGWIATTGWSASLTALSRYFFIVGDADGSGTDYCTINARTSTIFEPTGALGSSNHIARWLPTSTTGGWASGNTVSGSTYGMLVAVFSDSTSFGWPFTATTAPTSDTNRRGLRIGSAALIASVPIFGALWTSVNANISGIEIYSTANAPGTSPDNTSTDILYSTAAGRIGSLTSGGTPYTLTSGVAHRIVATFSGATSAGPQRLDIGTGADSSLSAAMVGGGNLYYARANGTTNWSNDLTTSLPAMGLLVDGQVAASGGGLMVPLGLHGGIVRI